MKNMPHARPRYLESLLRKVLTLSPLVGVLGHRQVGKTTLLSTVCDDYYTLDKATERTSAEADPEIFLKDRAGKRVALDECQSVPSLFPELKEWVRVHKQPGQFVLSGSVRFSSREAIKESLTGRIINLELLPFTVSELESRELPGFLHNCLGPSEAGNVFRVGIEREFKSKCKKANLDQYFERGGLPGVCFIREQKLRALKIDEQLNTILDRDLKMVRKTNVSLGDIKVLLGALVANQSSQLDFTHLQKVTQISVPTLKKLIGALEALFLIRVLPIEGSLKGHAVFFEDLAEANALLKGQKRSGLDLLAHFCFTQFRAQFHYRIGTATDLFQYRTRSGVVVPLAFRNPHGVLGVIPVEDPEALSKARAAAQSFLRSYMNSKAIITFNGTGPAKLLSDRILLAPLNSLI